MFTFVLQTRVANGKSDCDIDLDIIQDRLDVVEKKVCELETAIPKELEEWRKMQWVKCVH